MTDSRQIARAFFDKLCSGDFMGGFESLAEDATWTIIGDTPLSKHFTRDRLLTEMIPMLSTFREPARMAVSEIIAEGDRAVVIASVEGVGPYGPYRQDPYCFILRTRDGRISEIVEYLDTVAVETALVGRKLVDAR
ncbi:MULTISPECIES: nuclear transport factor 2 family protein [Novosphingobium]|jgi:ketosteroid isomerase-like protein|uniref:nuclear transport factor 2 family protein n=1 Tax=Novosphingobium TaxID=165696 RepID=UPI0022F261E7|nr:MULTISPECIES: nuclear transport factor 2 family protein [Novosphingobium]GLK43014.1 hypothetical protein GCM10017612_09310 [Novosphingobium resinovorum]